MKTKPYLSREFEDVKIWPWVLGILGFLAIVGLALFIINNATPKKPENTNTSQVETVENNDLTVEDKDEVKGDSDDDSDDTSDDMASHMPTKPEGLSSYTVTHVRDGDTIEVDGDRSAVRLIGVNTPETVDPNKEIECFGPEASSAMKELLGQTIELELDSSQGERDTHGRLLAYVWLGYANVNYALIYEGYGYEYTYDLPYKYQKQFKWAEESARSRQAGLWSACVGII